MASTRQGVEAFLEKSPAAALIEVAEAKGSTPREKGAWMLVSPAATFGTIGGGQLEFMAIARAREELGGFSPLEGEMAAKQPEGVRAEAWDLDSAPSTSSRSTAATTPPGPANIADQRPGGQARRAAIQARATLPSRGRDSRLDIPLGPEIGQCCGGRVEIRIRHIDAALRDELLATATAEDSAHPQVYLFGGGHVGHALASALSLLPLKVAVVETRADALEDMPATVTTRLTPVPEETVRAAPAGSAFVVLTHDHALDFLIVAEALRRQDAAYVGMIGSKTKKATFKSWFLKTAGGTEAEFARLLSPIGGSSVRDKRPAVIAALAAAEIMTALAEVK
jgi:xanthine dehydrogenase accessory factor